MLLIVMLVGLALLRKLVQLEVRRRAELRDLQCILYNLLVSGNYRTGKTSEN